MKAGFLNKLCFEDLGEIRGRPVYRLLEALYYRDHGGFITEIPKGFQTDLASVPRVPVIYMLWGDTAHREAILHDYLYRADCPVKASRLGADYYFMSAMISRHQPWMIYYPMFIGVRLLGVWSYHKLPINHNFFP